MKSPVVLLLAALAVALPRSSAAQVAPADLVGSWATPGSNNELGWTFRADSTLTALAKLPSGKATLTARWRISGDTLTVSGVSAKVNGRPSSLRVAKRKIELQKTKLTLTRLDNNESQTYDRVDSLVTPAAPAPAPSADSAKAPGDSTKKP